MRDRARCVVRDLGSTNGIRINGQRVESGRVRPGDELSIAHIRYRLEGGLNNQVTLADPSPGREVGPPSRDGLGRPPSEAGVLVTPPGEDNALAAAVRELLPAGLADRCRIQVIVQVPSPADG